MSGLRPILVLDPEGQDGRRLLESVAAAGYPALPIAKLDDLPSAASDGAANLAVLSFEALWPHPQEKLKNLREKCPSLKLLVAHGDASPRLRLGERLWSAGAMDFFVPRSLSPAELGTVLVQALGEHGTPAAPSAHEPLDPLRFLEKFALALASQRTVKELLRQLHLELPSLVPHALLQVVVVEHGQLSGHSFQVRPLEHKSIWALTEELASQLSSRLGRPVPPESLEFQDAAPLSADARAEPLSKSGFERLVIPLSTAQGLVGVVGILFSDRAAAERARPAFAPLGPLLAVALRQVQMLEEADRASLMDELTGTHNRRFLTQLLEAEWKRSQRYGLNLTVALLDVDHFKQLNDVYGHVVGDAVLKRLAGFVKTQLRDTDHLVRYGGEEFLVVMPETGPAEAAIVIERIRILAGSKPMFDGPQHGPIQVSFSAGVAGYPTSPAASAEELIGRADAALYQAKRDGRDRVCIAALPGDAAVAAEATVPSELLEARQFPRVPTRMHLRYLEIPDFETQMARMTAADISAGGISVTRPGQGFKKGNYGLVYLEEAQKPLLTKVVWTASGEDGQQRAGLRFVPVSELDVMVRGVSGDPSALRALVIARAPETQNLVARVLRAAQYEITQVHDQTELPADSDLSGYTLVVMGESALRGEDASILSRVSPTVRLVVVNEDSDKRKAIDTVLSHKVRHMVTAEQTSDEALFATLNKLLLGEYFGIRKYLLWGTKSKSWSLADPFGKGQVLDGVKSVADEVKCHPRITDLLLTAVDEMLINALYRAPEKAGGDEKKPVSVECGSDGRLLVVSVLDEYGRFRAEDLYAGLGRAKEHEQKVIPNEARSANLGFRIMLEALSQLAINVDPGRRTEIIGIVDLRKSLREYRSAAPAFNVFTKD